MKYLSRFQIFGLTLIILAIVPQAARCQEGDSASRAGSGSSQEQGFPTSGQAPVPAASVQSPFIRALNGANPFGGERGPLQWGWFSVRGAEYREFFDSVSFNTAGAPAPSIQRTVSRFATILAVSKQTQKLNLALQYQPDLYIANGQVYANGANQQLSLGTSFRLNERWTAVLRDQLSYFASQRAFSDLSLNVDYATGSTVTRNFLNGPGSVLYNSVGTAFNYLYSPTTTLSIDPSFGYQRSTGALTSGQEVSALIEGGRFSVTHLLSERSSIGASYFGQYAKYKNTSTTAGPQAAQILQDILMTYGRQMGATWRIGLSAGVTEGIGTGASGTGLGLGASITKSFQRSRLGATYRQGHSFNGFITGQSTRRVDALHQINWTQRLSTSTSAAYFTTTGVPRYSGTYVAEEMAFLLARRLSFVASYSHIVQTGDSVFILNARRNLATVGLRWNGSPLQ